MKTFFSLTVIAALFFVSAPSLADTEFAAGIGYSPWDSSFGDGRNKKLKLPDTFIKAMAAHFNHDETELTRLWHRGYGRNELIKLLLLSSRSKTPLAELVKARDKNTKLSKLCDRYKVPYAGVLADAETARKAINDKAAMLKTYESSVIVKSSSGTFIVFPSTGAQPSVSQSSTTPKVEHDK